jgi:enoyl-CoA hydratase/carnithine racemase
MMLTYCNAWDKLCQNSVREKISMSTQAEVNTTVLYQKEGTVAVISLNRPEQANAQNRELLVELDKAWDRAALDDEVKVILLRANGKHFSSGHDMSGGAKDKVQFEKDKAESGMMALYNYERKHYLGFSRKWRDIPKPSIAVVQGSCIAAGMMLCWPCDLILAADNAVFRDPVVMMGIGGVEYHGHTWELGARKAKEMLFTGCAINAEEARQLGMVNRVIPLAELDSHAMALAQQIAQMPAFGLAMAKRAVNQTLDIQGQYSAIQSVFDTHSIGHGSAVAQCGFPVLVGLEKMKQSGKEK